MVFGWGKRRRRKRIAGQATPPDWNDWLPAALPWYAAWPQPVRDKLVADIKIFIAEKDWEGCDGLQLVPEMQCVIAAQAAMMLTGIHGYCFDGVQTVLVYPGSFRRRTGDGLLVWSDSRIGEAWHRGPIVLSWSDVAQSWEGHNLVVHELAHHIDGIDGEMSGSPVFGNRQSQEEWEKVAAREFESLSRRVAAGRATFLDPYGATSRAEFFAVASEAFFEVPRGLRDHHPQLYRTMTGIFHSDPAEWS